MRRPTKGKIACLDINSGEVIWEIRVKKPRAHFSASPIIAGDHIYVTSEQGDTFVIKVANGEPKIVAENSLDEFIVASPVLVDGQILLRSDKNLYCIGKK